jgi:hypothetical protein
MIEQSETLASVRALVSAATASCHEGRVWFTKVRRGKNLVNHELCVSNVFIASRVWCGSHQNVKVRAAGCIQRTRNRRDRRKDSHADIQVFQTVITPLLTPWP